MSPSAIGLGTLNSKAPAEAAGGIRIILPSGSSTERKHQSLKSFTLNVRIKSGKKCAGLANTCAENYDSSDELIGENNRNCQPLFCND